MNEFRRRLADIVQNDNYIAAFADKSRRVVAIDNYSYSVNYRSAAAPVTEAALRSVDLIMDSDSDFICTYASAAARVTGATALVFNPAILGQVRDKSTGRTWFNIPTPLPHWCGAAGFPFLLTAPRIIRPRSTLTVTMQSAQAVSYDDCLITLSGGRIYYA